MHFHKSCKWGVFTSSNYKYEPHCLKSFFRGLYNRQNKENKYIWLNKDIEINEFKKAFKLPKNSNVN